MTITYQELAKRASRIAEESGEWCGAPVPIDSYPLSIAKGYVFQGLDGVKFGEDDAYETAVSAVTEAVEDKLKIINSWYCPQRGGEVVVYELNGVRKFFIDYDFLDRTAKALRRHLAAFEVANVQDYKAELKAMEKLQEMLNPAMFASYVLHGTFLETSKRSKVTYMFRKSRPTIALGWGTTGEMKFLAGLCLHPIGYYEGTFLGCMVPTDEIISHLVMMRAREDFFWRKANHHPIYAWQVGL